MRGKIERCVGKSERVSGVSVCGEKLRVSMLGEKVREEKDRLWVCHERERGRVSV